MSEVKHTPGPWSVEDPFDFELSIVEAGKPTHEWRFIASCQLPQKGESLGFSKKQVMANARLIAAAPDLLAVLERIARPLDCGCVPCRGQCRSQEALSIIIEEMQDDARAAIAKATGQ